MDSSDSSFEFEIDHSDTVKRSRDVERHVRHLFTTDRLRVDEKIMNMMLTVVNPLLMRYDSDMKKANAKQYYEKSAEEIGCTCCDCLTSCVRCPFRCCSVSLKSITTNLAYVTLCFAFFYVCIAITKALFVGK